MHIIEVNDIHKKYRRKKVLTGASFYADTGECVGIVGANGCGKSTLLNILSGSLTPNSGDILYNGVSAMHSRRIFSEMTGFVPQDNPLMGHLSVYDNLRFWYCGSGHNLDADMINGLPHRFGLDNYRNTDVSKLSGGMQKRLSIACALAKNPPITILDEPGASLDIVCKEDIKNYFTSYLEQNGTIVITSHEIGELSLCDRMYLLQDGILTEIPQLCKSVRKDDAIGEYLMGIIKHKS